MNKAIYPFYVMLHPIAGFSDLKYRKKESMLASIAIFLGLVILQAFSKQFAAPQLVMVNKENINIVMIFLTTTAISLMWAISNWAICVLIDGKAKFVEIWIFTMYSLLPYVVIGYLSIIISRLIIADENVFLSWLIIFSMLWSFVLILSAFSSYHEYSLPKSFLAIIYTAIGMCIITFLAFLLFSLYQQVQGTINTIIQEIRIRLR